MPEQAGSPRSGIRGRLLATGGALGAALVLGIVTPSAAGAVPAADSGATPAATSAPATPAPAEAHTQCQVTDARLPELSGLVVTGDHLLAMNDGGDRLTVYVLDSACQVTDVRTASVDPYDPEDLALAADGTVWLADTGDNRTERATVALLALRPDGRAGVYRLAYPDGPHDAEALLLAPDGTPYLVTKEVLGASSVYRPVAPIQDNGTVGLAKVAAVDFTLTGTPGGPVGRAGQLMVTGGAVSADGRLIALRTYTDAYVWPLTGSDVAGALAADPVRIALPEAPQGEAISFSADGQQLVVAGEGLPSDVVVVPVAAQLAPVTSAAPTVSPLGLAALDTGRSMVTSGVIAAVFATLAVWIAGKLRRRKV